MKTVLIITYYWPPAGGIEVQRVVKFCKYLREFGYEPRVLTVKDSTATASDPALCAEVAHIEVARAAAWEPHHVYYALTRRKPKAQKSQKQPGTDPSPSRPSLLQKIGEFIRLNCFIPDARIGWYPNAVREGLATCRNHPPNLIFSTAPPYTVHLIAKRLASKTGIPWVADFRDPWVENYAYNTQYRFPWVRWINERLERSVLNRADRVIVATDGQKQLQSAKARDGDIRFHCLTNGHDFSELPEPVPSTRFYLSYFGSLSAQRVPLTLFDTLKKLLDEHADFARDFRFRFAGRITPEARQLISERLPAHHCEFHPMLPHHEYRQRVIEHQLLLVLVDQVPHNDLILPAKCLEMITTGNPMLSFGPPGGDVDHFMRTRNCGILLDYPDSHGIETRLLEAWHQWKQGTLNTGARPEPDLHRRSLTQRLADVFSELS
jgi:glycosyltransferase involved in cell wall biosynthesis